MEEVFVTGLLSKTRDKYVVTTDDGTEYELSAILPWEAVAADYGTERFAQVLGKRVEVSGMTDGSTIWGARVTPIQGKNHD
jgi:hypothetical protein